eukprot:TRINITY_DN25688_c0_g1_i2.p1 TRINITY_DN25688_c0_g1~~TRINITY_DN25688_c0_g1_i2.p1  ORF type:complete len:445 (+),score=99.04 TRINITY_DN25688_c0_g1_i2:26-1360(+)
MAATGAGLGDPAFASIEIFDPTALRCEVLRRYAMEAQARQNLVRAATGDGGSFAGQAAAAPTTQQPATAAADAQGQAPSQRGGMDSAGQAATAGQTTAAPGTQGQAADASAGQGVAGDPDERATAACESTAVPTADIAKAAKAGQPGLEKQPSCNSHFISALCSNFLKVPAKLWGLIGDQARLLMDLFKTFTYLSFKSDSLFHSPCVEELYQRNRLQHWSPKLDWSVIAFLQMFIWDLAANPSFRLRLLFLFYAASMVLVFAHKCFVLILPCRPVHLRAGRGVLMCSFFLGRWLACQPLLVAPVPDDPAAMSVQSLKVASSLIGLGMTNLSAVLALQLDTLDTFLLCVSHFIACATWAVVALQIAAGEALQTLILGHCVVACVCIWQQHEQERFDRISFEQELLMARGLLLRNSDNVARQSAQADFSCAYQVLHQARVVQHINF